MLQEAHHALPISVQNLQGFVEDVAKSKTLPLLRADKLENSTLGMTLGVTLYAVKVGEDPIYHALIQLQAPLQDGKVENINHEMLKAKLLDLLDEQSVLLDLKDGFNSIYKTYLNKILKYSAAGFIAIIFLLLIALRSLQKTFFVIFAVGMRYTFCGCFLAFAGLTTKFAKYNRFITCFCSGLKLCIVFQFFSK